MKPQILIPDPSAEYYFKEGCHILELLNNPVDPEASIARARVDPGVRTRLHRLKGTTERYVILEGEGAVEVGDLPPQRVGPGDVILIPPECGQCIENTATRPLVFLAICTPRFTKAAYIDG